jgi:hypothetical protein
MVRGQQMKLRGFPKNYKVPLFRVVVSAHRTEHVVTNDVAQDSVQGAREVCKVCTVEIGAMHREVKQRTGRSLPVSQGADSAQPYPLCFVGVDASQTTVLLTSDGFVV